MFAGPVQASLVRVIDGDTVDVAAQIWPGQVLRVAVRIRGVDAPELRGKCRAETSAAKTTRDRLETLIGDRPLQLVDISGDKYFGRVVADIVVPGGERVSAYLLSRGLARPYRGQRRGGWCN